MRTRSVQKVKRAFTLIEILIVVVILGILAAIVIPQFAESADAAKESSVKSTLQTVRSQLELYRFKEGNYPAGATFEAAMNVLVTNDPPYLQQVPVAPEPYTFSYNATTGAVTVGCQPDATCADGHADW